MGLTPEPPSDRLDTAIDRFSGVRTVSLSAVFRPRSRHDRYMMTTMTARPPTVTALKGPATLAINLWEPRNGVSLYFNN